MAKTNKQPKTITEEELAKFNNFINNRKDLLSNLGAAELQLITIKRKKDQLFTSLQNLDILERDFNQELTNKYGNVTVNTITGEIS